jgi:hypothetical protein
MISLDSYNEVFDVANLETVCLNVIIVKTNRIIDSFLTFNGAHRLTVGLPISL